MPTHNYTVYCDGAYSAARNQGGIGFVILENDKEIFHYSKMYKNSTNQRMEQMAVIVALESIKEPSEVTIVTDSMYIVGTLTKGWKRKANQDLWERMDKAVNRHKVVSVNWVKGHSESEYNKKADKLAYNASNELG
jgi:ribonuclease HI